VKRLLEYLDINPNPADEDGQTSVLGTAKDGHGEVVKMLLARVDIYSNTVDKDGQTPHFWSA